MSSIYDKHRARLASEKGIPQLDQLISDGSKILENQSQEEICQWIPNVMLHLERYYNDSDVTIIFKKNSDILLDGIRKNNYDKNLQKISLDLLIGVRKNFPF